MVDQDETSTATTHDTLFHWVTTKCPIVTQKEFNTVSETHASVTKLASASGSRGVSGNRGASGN